MKILITGGAGFIGSHFAERVVSKKNQTLVLDDLSTGSISNLSSIWFSSYFKFIKGSVLDFKLLENLVNRVDVIYHLAASVGVRMIIEDPVHSIENNILGTINVLRLAAKKKKKILITSTSEVYGKSSKETFGEDDDLVFGSPFKSRWNYASSKLLDEHLGLAYFKKNHLPVTIVRLFNTVGERQTGRYGMVIPLFMKQAMSNQDITVYGDGSQSRCFCYVKDVVWAMTKLMDNKESFGNIYNIGGVEEVRINDLADRIIGLTNSLSKKVYIPYEKVYGGEFDEPKRRKPDISKIKSLIGFEPKTKLSDILLAVKAFYEHE
ncbi:GDP-mannose 4,6-dehydratase [Candidatus Gottesmanbacteria bacterium]|nr:GDP-mannose 4,6-dehydratase [Candidatus Gottesmanbacteria bacterium]